MRVPNINNGQSENNMDDLGVPPISGNFHMDLEWDIVGCHGSVMMCVYIYITLHYITSIHTYIHTESYIYIYTVYTCTYTSWDTRISEMKKRSA